MSKMYTTHTHIHTLIFKHNSYSKHEIYLHVNHTSDKTSVRFFYSYGVGKLSLVYGCVRLFVIDAGRKLRLVYNFGQFFVSFGGMAQNPSKHL